MTITRRHILLSLPIIAAPWRVHTAMAATFTPEELMQPGPLGEKSLGKEDATVTLIEYASMTCGHCAAFHTTTYPQLKTRYIEPGKLRYILREYPFDPLAMAGFMLARGAEGDKFFPLVELLFQTQKSWMGASNPADALFDVVKQAGLTREKFETILKDQKLLDGINAVRERGAKLFGVNSTPTFFINGEKWEGNKSIDEMAQKIDPLLNI